MNNQFRFNLFNHVDNINDFLIGAKRLLKENGELILEVPDLSSLINKFMLFSRE